jgi:hypothetical protein
MQAALEGGGAAAGCSALDARSCLVVARRDAISVYTRDARGPVFVFPGMCSQETTNWHLPSVGQSCQAWQAHGRFRCITICAQRHTKDTRRRASVATCSAHASDSDTVVRLAAHKLCGECPGGALWCLGLATALNMTAL